jgi:CRP/FNR family transcriptional regulator, nitrogen fixation regulation protein
LLVAWSTTMLVKSARTTATPDRNDDPRIDQFGAIDFGSHLTLTTNYFAKDAQIFGQGDPSDNVYEVVRGAVRSCKLLSDGRCQITAFHLPVDIFGFDLGDTSAEAIVDTSLRIAKRRSLQQAALGNAAVGNDLWCLTASKLKRAEDHLLLLGRKTALERVMSFLVEMDCRLDASGDLPLPMTRRDIGDYLGLTLETVSRVLSALHDKGVINFSGGARHIVLRNRDRLRSLEVSMELN